MRASHTARTPRPGKQSRAVVYQASIEPRGTTKSARSYWSATSSAVSVLPTTPKGSPPMAAANRSSIRRLHGDVLTTIRRMIHRDCTGSMAAHQHARGAASDEDDFPLGLALLVAVDLLANSASFTLVFRARHAPRCRASPCGSRARGSLSAAGQPPPPISLSLARAAFVGWMVMDITGCAAAEAGYWAGYIAAGVRGVRARDPTRWGARALESATHPVPPCAACGAQA